ncbi:MAG: hypothetical protein FWF28_03230, partial [Micrococcales bacterium]|nr:hypothetical protein [Micrococcales bacterium]
MLRKNAVNLAAMGVGMGPGVLYPFAVAYFMLPADSDSLMLALSVSLFMINVVQHQVEANSIACVGRVLGRGCSVASRELRRAANKGLAITVPFVVIGSPVILLLYTRGSVDSYTWIVATLILASIPLLGSWSGVYSGRLIVAGQIATPIATQGLRSIFPLAGLLSGLESHMLILCVLAGAGELVRLVILVWQAARLNTPGRAGVVDISWTSLYWQFFSSTATQANPVIDNAFLTTAGVGYITAYGLSDKISFTV